MTPVRALTRARIWLLAAGVVIVAQAPFATGRWSLLFALPALCCCIVSAHYSGWLVGYRAGARADGVHHAQEEGLTLVWNLPPIAARRREGAALIIN